MISTKRCGASGDMASRGPVLGCGGAGAASAGRTMMPFSSIHTLLGMLITPNNSAST